MNFQLTDERQMLQDSLRRFLADRYTVAARTEAIADPSGYSPAIWTQLADLGVLGALLPEAFGGYGGAGFDIATVFEELGRAGVVEPVLDSAVLCGALLCGPRDAQPSPRDREYLERLVAGDLQLAFAHGEPTSRYERTWVETTATVDGQDIVLTGRKTVVVNAEAAELLIVSAREGGASGDRDGLSLFLVDPQAAGVRMQGSALLAGGRAAEIELDGVRLPLSARLGSASGAATRIETALATAEVALAAETLGAMETATRLTMDYLTTRQQFGRPIGTFQALQHRVAEMLIEVEQARSAVINAAGHLGDTPQTRDRHIAAARNLIGRTGRHIAEEAIQLHGGIAMTAEYELAHIAKRIVMAEHRFGDADTQLERFIDLAAA
ncbi:acyl-CoA dehydrogenase family protein [Phaeobacter gallaeciensis]|uniref:Acyl-CoA dehydrogenase n=1 Tax=Phaeobacter gallaeciensis TaxID=60890 RepID=A0AAC9ZBT8_9RHOB|nr:acyl-CoA dehydrogenase family protein [Phaeobacter gallaeciensis]AHD10816.1 Acyl-CoA dehydrogenase [Phaeobacter gallaeciensis DSM 26640]ATE94079.1 putative acyl-CoA dehydrogenase [Phaeobacter gallaeciensis]ATE96100.1 putative acyl-CoA dehydrogenase [Phaeobacter gallaeciensis]ATF02743.1 putative acyl-CoA dehydrogenase [Phaeobacter gallaeciensis]ATF07123.1 putative acyl-CoA dehydrogenase [Phaeobacter gallaeciensis]